MTELNLKIVESRKEHYDELINDMPYNRKVEWAEKRIEEFINECIEYNKKEHKNHITEITVSFSGGKDSTVLLDLVLKVRNRIKCNISITPLYAMEITFPSTLKFINDCIIDYQKKYNFLNGLYLVKPKMPWNDILETKGYPIFSKQISVLINRIKNAYTKNSLCKWFFGIDKKNTSTSKYKLSKERLFLLDDRLKLEWPKLTEQERKYFNKYNDFYFFSEKCCDYVKGNVKHDSRPSFVGVMADESEMRKKSWIHNGCNIFGSKQKKSRPLSIWKTKDVWQYIKENNLEINEAYGFDSLKSYGEQDLRFSRLGCTSCPFGSSIEQRAIETLIKNKNYKSLNQIKNRYEKLFEYNYALYRSQVITTGMYKILIDMGIQINCDELYMQLFHKRWKQIKKWNNNFRTNLLRLLAQIENQKNYKCKRKKGLINPEWEYKLDEIKQALKYFKLDYKITKKEFDEIRVKEQEFYKNNVLKHLKK